MPQAPPKPWERASAGSTPASTVPAAPTTQPASTSPDLPAGRPSTIGATGSSLSPYNSAYGATSRYGTGGYGSYGGLGSYGGGYGSTYGSPYSRFAGGGYGGLGGLGGYGGGFGGFGGGMFGQPGYGMPGMPGPQGPDGLSLSQRMESGTQATFQIIESIVGAFGGFAQMLESTFMATHSSFFAMIGVAEQFGNLRNYLGQVLSIFTLIRWLQGLIARLTGREPPAGPPLTGGAGFNADSFHAFEAGHPVPGPSNAPRPSRKPLVVFFLTVIGLPYLMTRLVRLINERQLEEARARGEQPGEAGGNVAVDPATLTFVRATHPYTAQDPNLELTFAPNDILAILTPVGERQHPGWWRARLRDGRVGFIPSTYVTEVTMGKSVDGPAKKLDDEPPPPTGDGRPAAGAR